MDKSVKIAALITAVVAMILAAFALIYRYELYIVNQGGVAYRLDRFTGEACIIYRGEITRCTSTANSDGAREKPGKPKSKLDEIMGIGGKANSTGSLAR